MTDKKKVTSLTRVPTEGRSTKAARESEPTSGSRVPWNGGLSDDEMCRPGGALMAALLYRANELGHQLAEMATELNCTYGYIAQLRGGHRHPENISDEFVTAVAAYLGVPRMTVLMLCGRVKADDVMLQKHNVAQEIPAAMDFIARDPVIGSLMPLEVRKTSYETQFFIISLYEKATGKTLLNGRQDPKELAEQLSELLAQQASLQQEVDAARKVKATKAKQA